MKQKYAFRVTHVACTKQDKKIGSYFALITFDNRNPNILQRESLWNCKHQPKKTK